MKLIAVLIVLLTILSMAHLNTVNKNEIKNELSLNLCTKLRENKNTFFHTIFTNRSKASKAAYDILACYGTRYRARTTCYTLYTSANKAMYLITHLGKGNRKSANKEMIKLNKCMSGCEEKYKNTKKKLKRYTRYLKGRLKGEKEMYSHVKQNICTETNLRIVPKLLSKARRIIKHIRSYQNKLKKLRIKSRKLKIKHKKCGK